jgi:hypothetical protein
VAYHAKVVPVKDSENKQMWKAPYRSILLVVLEIGLRVHVCFCPGHPQRLKIRVSSSPVGMGHNQIGCHRVSDTATPMGHVDSEFVTKCPSHLLPHYVDGGRW